MNCIDTHTGCESESNPILVTFATNPSIPVITSIDSVCYGDSIILYAPNVLGSTTDWYADSSLTISLGSGSNITVYNLTVDSTFYLVQTVSGCSSPIASKKIIVNAIPATPNISSDFSVCEGDSINLTTSTNGMSYMWFHILGFSSTAQNPSIYPSTSNDAGPYHLIITDANGCKSIDTTVIVSINTKPSSPFTSNNSPICDGDTLQLVTATICDEILWINNLGDTLISNSATLSLDNNHSAYTDGLWQMICVDTLSGCKSAPTTRDTIVFNPSPPFPFIDHISASHNNGSPMCYGDTVYLIAGPVVNATYSWTTTDTTLITNNSTAIVNNLTSDTSFYLFVSVNGCSIMDTVFVQVNPPLALPIPPNDTSVCEGVILTPNVPIGAYTYIWTNPMGMSTTDPSPTLNPVTLQDSGTYTLAVEDTLGCKSADTTFQLFVNPLPSNPLINSNSPVCEGETLILKVTSNGSQYSWLGASGSSFIDGDSISISYGDVDYGPNWQVISIDTITGCKSSSVSHTIVINPKPPTIVASNGGPVCYGDSVVLSTPFVAGAAYSWYTIDSLTLLGNSNTIVVQNITVDSAFLLVVDMNGCTDTDSTLVLVNTLPLAPSLQDTLEVCLNDTIFLSTNTIAVTYNWSGPMGFSSSQQNPFIFPANVLHDSIFTLNIQDTNSCTSSDTSIRVIVNTLPLSPIISGINNNICDGDTLMLVSDINCGQSIWIDPQGNTILGTDSLVVTSNSPNYLGGGWNMLCVDTTTGCQSTSNTFTIAINSTPAIPLITHNAPICSGDSLGLEIALVAGASYEWYTPDSILIGSSSSLTVYGLTNDTIFIGKVIVNGCVSLDTAIITVNVLPVKPDIFVLADTICEQYSIDLNTSTISSVYNWSGPNGFSSNLQNPSINNATILDGGLYLLSVEDAAGCTSQDTSVFILVNPQPVQPVIIGPSDICQGDTLTLTSNNSCDLLLWKSPNINFITLSNSLNLNVIPSAPDYVSGDWELICQDTSTGCSSIPSAVHNVNINSLPASVALINDGPVCFNEGVNISLSQQGPSTYIWSSNPLISDTLGVGTSVFVDSIISDSFIYIQIIDPIGCSILDSNLVILNPPLTAPDISAVDSIICEGEDILLSTTTVASVYNWSGPNGFFSNQQSPVIFSADPTLNQGVYTLRVEDNNGCLSLDTSIYITVHYNMMSSVSISAISGICYGDSVIIQTGGTICDSTSWLGPVQTQWGTGNQTFAVPGDSNYIDGTWTLMCYDTTSGCVSVSNTILVTIEPALSTPVAINSGPICVGDSINLSVSQVISATTTWYADSNLVISVGTGDNIFVSGILTDTTFYCQQVVNGCASPVGSTDVFVYSVSLPPSISDSVIVCEGEDIILGTTTTGQSYTWTGPNSFISNQQNPVISSSVLPDAGSYTLSMIDTNGCLAPDSTLIVVVNSTPVSPVISYNNLLCDSDTLNITSTGSCNQNIWTGPSGVPIITNTNTLDIFPNNSDYQNGNWSLLCVDTTTGCQSLSNLLSVSFDPIPNSGTITHDAIVCFGDSVDISTTTINNVAPSGYNWYTALTSSVANGQSINVPNITVDSTFYLFVTTLNGCNYLVDSAVIVSNPQMAPPPVQSNSPVCEGDDILLFTVSAQAYNWSGPNSYVSSAQNPLITAATTSDAGNYTLNVFDFYGCPSLDTTINIVVNALPPTPIATGPSAICYGDTLFLTTSANCDSMVWKGPNVDIVGGNIAIPSNSVNYIDGNWELHCFDTIAGCQVISNIVNVTFNFPPNIVPVNNGPVCVNDSVVLTASFVAGVSYLWYSDSLLSVTLGTSHNLTVDSIVSDTSFYLLTSSNGCSSSLTSTTVNVNTTAPAPNINSSSPVCEGNNLVLSTTTIVSNYSWTGPNGFSSNQSSPVITGTTIADTGFYFLSIIDTNGCTSLDTSIYVVIDTLPAAPIITSSVYICQGDTLFLSVDSTSNHCDSLVWVGPNGINYAVPGSNISILPSDTNYINGQWELICIDTSSGCSSISNVSQVTILALPAPQSTSSNSPVCIGGDVNLSTPNAAPSSTYTWYADSNLITIAATGQNPTITDITIDTNFYLVISSLGCNSLPILTPVTVVPTAVAPSIPGDFSVCEGEPIVMTTSTSAVSYLWTSTNGFTDSTQNPVVTSSATIADTGNYTLVIIDSSGCISSDTSLYLSVNILGPAPVITSNTPICEGDTLVLTSSNICGQSQWIGPNGSSPNTLGLPGGSNVLWTIGSSTQIPFGNPNYLGGDWYTICIDTITGCQVVSDTITVAVNSVPIIVSVLNNGPLCPGDTASLSIAATTSGGSLTVNWYSDSNMSTLIGTGSSLNIPNINTTSNYYADVLGSNGCNSMDSTTVLIHPSVAAPELPPDMIICEGDPIVLTTTTVASTYNWSGPNGFSSNVQFPGVITSTILDSGTYTLNVIDSNGCQSLDSTVNVTINTLPLGASVSNNGPACLGDSVTLSATLIPGVTYNWLHLPFGTSVGSTQNITISNLTYSDSGSYVVVTTLNGCSTVSTDTTIVSVLGIGTATAFAGLDQDLCGVNTVIMDATAAVPPVLGTWTTSSTAIIGNVNDPNTLVTNLSLGSYVFYWSLSSTTCSSLSTDSVIITVNPQSTDTALAGVDQTLCDVTSAILGGNTPLISTGAWSQSSSQISNGVIINNSSNPSSTISGLQPGNIYTFVWEFTNGVCGMHSSDTVTIDINIAPSDNAFAGGDIVTCGQDTVSLDALSSTLGAGFWTTDSSAIIISPTLENSQVTNLLQDTSTFVWTLSNGICTNYSSDTVLVILSNISPVANPDSFSAISGTNTTINVLPNDILTTNWDIYINTTTSAGQLINLNNGLFDVILQISDSTNQTFIYELCNPDCPNSCDTALVLLSVSSNGDCTVPNIFTPNGDGVNDMFEIPCLNTLPEAWLIVFNRWGDVVYESDKYHNQWDGKHNENDLPDGTYFYILKLDNGDTMQGSVEIRR
ncbi:MAG: gliding motility-associated C-terminal domain-containing protein [Saprospiraceae bacterium]|nr:gliding motility-associated C-terminal domain-containing protein [Saprospiraceae bacterium]